MVLRVQAAEGRYHFDLAPGKTTESSSVWRGVREGPPRVRRRRPLRRGRGRLRPGRRRVRRRDAADAVPGRRGVHDLGPAGPARRPGGRAARDAPRRGHRPSRAGPHLDRCAAAVQPGCPTSAARSSCSRSARWAKAPSRTSPRTRPVTPPASRVGRSPWWPSTHPTPRSATVWASVASGAAILIDADGRFRFQDRDSRLLGSYIDALVKEAEARK